MACNHNPIRFYNQERGVNNTLGSVRMWKCSKCGKVAKDFKAFYPATRGSDISKAYE